MSRAIRPAARAAALLAVLALAPAGAGATCPSPALILPNVGYSLYSPYDHDMIQVSRPYWIGYATWAQNPASDEDCYMFSSGSGGTDPLCYSGTLASSILGAGKTDFVVGDFNHNPVGTYYPLGKCFNPCPTGPVGEMGWRDGDLLTVNSAPTNITIGDTDYQEMLLHCFDVYLTSGTKYFFRFKPYGVDQTKMLLFCNHAGGVYWAGRSAAEFEVTGCTTYIAPVTGYYGVVVVNEAHYTGYSNGYSIGVSTDPACDCASPLASGVPQTEDFTQNFGYFTATQTWDYWMGVGVRGFGGDWDLYAAAQTVADPQNACFTSSDALSNGSTGADVIVGDFNPVFSYPYTESFEAKRYSGAYGADTEMEGGNEAIQPNGPDAIGTMTADEVVRMWDIGGLFGGQTYTFQLLPYGADLKYDIFHNPTGGLYWTGRAWAALESNGTATYSPSVSKVDGVAVIKDDTNSGAFLLRCGQCETPIALTSETSSFLAASQNWVTFQQSDTAWAAVAAYASGVDFDIEQYGSSGPSSWPDCFGSPGAVSNQGLGVMDFVIGDFHHNAPGAQFARPYEFTPGVFAAVDAEWDGGRGALTVNAAPVGASADGVDGETDRLWCYQVYLQNGIPYTFEFAPTGSAALKLLLFQNPGGSTYWAPRSAAVFSATSNQPYTATATGWYGVVVVNDNDQNGAFTVRVSSTVLAADDHAFTGPTALRGLYPNPTEGALRIRFALAESAPVSFDVLDMAGRMVARVTDPAAGAGPGEIEWDGRGASGQRLAAGVYFVRMTAGARTIATRRVALIK